METAATDVPGPPSRDPVNNGEVVNGGEVTLHGVDRRSAFIDAVVAIAMTVLIFPLLESVSTLAARHASTAAFFHEYDDQLVSFALSFVIIASFWMSNHGLFARLRHVTPLMLALQILWMFTIVWLPVPTAMIGIMSKDRLQGVVYIGTMLTTSVIALLINATAMRHPEIWNPHKPPSYGHLAASMALSLLYLVAVAAFVIVPGLSYYVMFVMMLTAPLQRVMQRRLESWAARRSAPVVAP